MHSWTILVTANLKLVSELYYISYLKWSNTNILVFDHSRYSFNFVVLNVSRKCVNYLLVWIALNAFFFFFFFQLQLLTWSFVNSVFMHGLWVPQTLFFINFFIKNGSHGTIYTFKNYFATVFSVFSFSKISSIQTDQIFL